MKVRLTAALFCVLCLARTVCAQNQYFLPHVPNGQFGGGSFRTTFILFNNNDTSVNALLTLTDDGANPLSVTIPGLGTGSQFTLNLDAGATRILRTNGAGSLVAGAATVTATAKIGVSALLTVYNANGEFVTESEAGSSEPLAEFVIPVDARELFNTGLALFNAGFVPASATLILLNTDGKEVARTSVTLNQGAHVARFVTGAGQFFPSVSNFRGTLQIQSLVPLAAVALRQSESPLSYTSLPVVSKSSTRLALNLAQVASGSFQSGNFRTSFLIFNVSSSTAKVELSLTKSDGTAFVVTIAGHETASTFNFTLLPGASLFLQTDGSGALSVGAARITSNVPIGATAIFSVFDSQGRFRTEAGVGDTPVLTELTFPVDITGNFDTSVAFFNPGNAAITLTLRLLDSDGVLVGAENTITLQASNHTARFVSQLFAGTTNFVGSVAVSAPRGVTALTLRQNSAPLSYTSLPVRSGASRGKALTPGLLYRIRTGVSATSDVTVDESLSAGLRLSGTITYPAGALLVTARSASGEIFAGLVSSANRYLVFVAPGTYTLSVCFRPVEVSSGSVTVIFTDPNPVQVTADTTRGITLPSVNLFNVSGSISGLSTLPSWEKTVLVLTSTDGVSQGEFRLGSTGSYQGELPAGSYMASLVVPQVRFSNRQIESMALFNLGSVNIGNAAVTANFNVPETARLSGQITGVSALPGGSVTASDTSAPTLADLARCASDPSSSSVGVDASKYQLILSKDRSYQVQLMVFPPQEFEEGVVRVLETLYFPVVPAPVILNGDTSFDLNVPGLPGRVAISGRVTDSAGRGVGKVVVAAHTLSVTGAPNVGFVTGAITDSNGSYRFTVLSGTDYEVLFIPP